MFEQIEISEQLYEVGTPSKTPTRAETNRDTHIRKRKVVESDSSSNPEKGLTGKRKTKNSGSPSDVPTRAENICFLHGPGNKSEECKVLIIYSKKYAAQLLH